MQAKIATSKRFNIVSLTDWHCPYHDEKALEVALAFCKLIQPQIIIIHEAHDFYSLSSFDKDPNRINSLQEEIDQVTKYFWALRKLCPKSRIILLGSNHLYRLRKYLWRQAPAFAGLRSLEIPKLLDLDTFKIEYKDTFTFRDVLFKHGNKVSSHSAYTAKKEFEKEGMSGVTGHTHRLGQYYATKRGGSYTWIESGCLCDLNPEYIEGTPDWQHGISLVSFEPKGKHFYAYPIPIVNYEIHWGDTTICLKDKSAKYTVGLTAGIRRPQAGTKGKKQNGRIEKNIKPNK